MPNALFPWGRASSLLWGLAVLGLLYGTGGGLGHPALGVVAAAAGLGLAIGVNLMWGFLVVSRRRLLIEPDRLTLVEGNGTSTMFSAAGYTNLIATAPAPGAPSFLTMTARCDLVFRDHSPATDTTTRLPQVRLSGAGFNPRDITAIADWFAETNHLSRWPFRWAEPPARSRPA